MRLIYFTSIVTALGVLLAGCGGGGGGGVTGSNRLTYTTDWTNFASPGEIQGVSQRIVLTSSSGDSSSVLMNKQQNALQSVDITNLKAGNYHLQATLYSGADASGVSNGTIDAELAISGATTFLTAVGEQPTGVKVTPTSTAVTIPESAQFYAYATGPSGRPTFTTSNQFTWNVLGGVGTISQNGVLSSSAAGVGTIRATYTPNGAIGSASITVSTQQVVTSKWTVLVYMNAANDLSQFDTLNINQMEAVAGNPDVRFVVQWKQASGYWDTNPEFVGTRRYLVKADNDTSTVNSTLVQDLGTGIDMGSAQTLNDFTRWAKTYYPAQRYCLVIWNHGNGWHRGTDTLPPTRGVSYDDDTGNHIDTWQLAQALGGTKWDIVSWDASLMQMMEVAYEIKDVAKYVVGSEESPPGEGLPYDLIFKQFRDNPDASTPVLTKAFVDGMLNDPRYTNRKITQSSVDTSKLDTLRSALSTLSDTLVTHQAQIGPQVPTIRSTTKSYSQTTTRWYYDIGDLCDKINANVTLPDVNAAATNVKTALQSAVIYEGHNSLSAGSTGLSIDFSPSGSFAASDYANLRFGQESTWRNWLSVAP